MALFLFQMFCIALCVLSGEIQLSNSAHPKATGNDATSLEHCGSMEL
jgi:hypothetical protein